MTYSEILTDILPKFDLDGKPLNISEIKSGHINNTYSIECDNGKKYILQQININVFKKPDELTSNINNVCNFLYKKISDEGLDPERRTLKLFPTVSGDLVYKTSNSVWRVYNFITDATAHQSADLPNLLYYAAKGFGVFQRRLADYPAETLYETIPFFHDTVHRYEDFMNAVENDTANRVNECTELIEKIKKYEKYAHIIVDGLNDGTIPIRVTHNDTKLNNIMIDDKTCEGICVIDLDTVMPGSLLYDFGDSIRFAANNGLEDDKNLDNVFLRLDLFDEYTKGFIEGLDKHITEKEIDLLPESALILTYELVLRFLGDYLNGDTYFKIEYPNHNLVRAKAQMKLTDDIFSKLDEMHKIVDKYR